MPSFPLVFRNTPAYPRAGLFFRPHVISGAWEPFGLTYTGRRRMWRGYPDPTPYGEAGMGTVVLADGGLAAQSTSGCRASLCGRHVPPPLRPGSYLQDLNHLDCSFKPCRDLSGPLHRDEGESFSRAQATGHPHSPPPLSPFVGFTSHVLWIESLCLAGKRISISCHFYAVSLGIKRRYTGYDYSMHCLMGQGGGGPGRASPSFFDLPPDWRAVLDVAIFNQRNCRSSGQSFLFPHCLYSRVACAHCRHDLRDLRLPSFVHCLSRCVCFGG